MMVLIRKRKLHEPKKDSDYWLKQTPEQRIQAVETIRLSHDSQHAKQPFPRVHRITRKKRG